MSVLGDVMTGKPAMKKVNTNTSGILPPSAKFEIGGEVTTWSSKSISELLELRERQLKLLNNKPFIRKLADKGSKIQTFYDKIVVELKSKYDEEKTCKLFTQMRLGGGDNQCKKTKRNKK